MPNCSALPSSRARCRAERRALADQSVSNDLRVDHAGSPKVQQTLGCEAACSFGSACLLRHLTTLRQTFMASRRCWTLYLYPNRKVSGLSMGNLAIASTSGVVRFSLTIDLCSLQGCMSTRVARHRYMSRPIVAKTLFLLLVRLSSFLKRFSVHLSQLCICKASTHANCTQPPARI